MPQWYIIFDNAGNITDVDNNAGVVNGLGGNYTYDYQYDSLYRLVGAQGEFINGNTYTFDLGMTYSASGNITSKTLDAYKLINSGGLNVAYDHDYNYNTSQPHTINDINDQYFYSWDANGNMTSQQNYTFYGSRSLCWDEENRLTAVKEISDDGDHGYLSGYIYNAGGERVWKFEGVINRMYIDGVGVVDNAVLDDKTLYASPYLVATDELYTKHYYIEGQRISSKIGGGFDLAPTHPLIEQVDLMEFDITNIENYDEFKNDLWEFLLRQFDCVDQNPDEVEFEPTLFGITDFIDSDEPEEQQYFYHPDHLGSSAFITNIGGDVEEHLQYLPFGESFVFQKVAWETRFTFSGKEKDKNTGYHFPIAIGIGARYYDSEVSVWLSVDPLASGFPGISAYAYCYNNPLNYVDPWGLSPEGDEDKKNNSGSSSNNSSRTGYGNTRDLKTTYSEPKTNNPSTNKQSEKVLNPKPKKPKTIPLFGLLNDFRRKLRGHKNAIPLTFGLKRCHVTINLGYHWVEVSSGNTGQHLDYTSKAEYKGRIEWRPAGSFVEGTVKRETGYFLVSVNTDGVPVDEKGKPVIGVELSGQINETIIVNFPSSLSSYSWSIKERRRRPLKFNILYPAIW